MIHTRVITLGMCIATGPKSVLLKKEDTSPHYTIPMVTPIIQIFFKNFNTLLFIYVKALDFPGKEEDQGLFCVFTGILF